MSRTATVAGATGLVGSALLQQLAARPDHARINVLGRTPPGHESGTISFVHTDFGDLDAVAGALAVDAVYCCLGTTQRKAGSEAAFERVDYHMVVDLARAAKAAGARKFLVVSAAGASARSPAFYSRVKARMEQAVRDIGFEAVHIVRPSLLLGDRAESRPAERLFQWLAPLYSPFLRGPLRRYRPVEASDVAAAMIRLADSPATGAHVHHLPLES